MTGTINSVSAIKIRQASSDISIPKNNKGAKENFDPFVVDKKTATVGIFKYNNNRSQAPDKLSPSSR